MLMEYSVADGVAHLTLQRPEKRNALNPELVGGLRESLDRAAADGTARVILLRGAGKDFCAGLDLSTLTLGDNADSMDYLADARPLADLYLAMRRTPKPVIGAVHGRALGGGCGLATACDLVVAAESAQFHYTEINLGFVAAMVAAILRRNAGEKQAFEILTRGEPLSARDAQQAGMVNHVWADDEFDSKTGDYARTLARKSSSALALTKSVLYQMDGMNFETAIQAGVWVNALARGTADTQRGIEGFARKKK
jgi:methylglutaconyl-CoA hydratase